MFLFLNFKNRTDFFRMPEPKAVISEQSDGSLNFNYKPQDVRAHELHVTHNDKTVAGLQTDIPPPPFD